MHSMEMKTSIKIVKLGELSKFAYEDLILSINTRSSSGKVTFGLVKKVKSKDFPVKNCKVAWDRLVSKYKLVHDSFYFFMLSLWEYLPSA